MLADAGNPVIWRCHIGVDNPNELARSAWRFLEPYVERADQVVFSRKQFAWDVVDPARRTIIAPSIDPLAPKNQDLAEGAAAAILQAAGLRAGTSGDAAPNFVRLDGTTATVGARAEVDEDAPRQRGAHLAHPPAWGGDRYGPRGVFGGDAEEPIGPLRGGGSIHQSRQRLSAPVDVPNRVTTQRVAGKYGLRPWRALRDDLTSGGDEPESISDFRQWVGSRA